MNQCSTIAETADASLVQRGQRWKLGALVALAVAGAIVGWGGGALPVRDHVEVPSAASASASDSRGEVAAATASGDTTAPDLQLYREVVAEVRAGGDYYAVARERIPKFGFPIHSPLNWRLPTYAWVFAQLPSPIWIQAALVSLSVAGLALAFAAENRRSGPLAALGVTLLLVGVVRWSLDGEAFYTQEAWAATLILLSFAAYALNWRGAAVLAGVAALLFRELALPYCLVAGALALYRRRYAEAAGWTLGVAIFFGYFAWHVLQVKAQLAGLGQPGGTDLSQWLRWGGLDFVLLTGRMNGLLFAAPAVLLWFYLLGSLTGLSSRGDDASLLACYAAMLYVLAFAVVGRTENFYWGLMYAPLLPWGIGSLLGWLRPSQSTPPRIAPAV